ncbi:MAG: chromosome segregation protein SMC [Nocardioides sp.]
MYLKSLTLKGFKSFASATTLHLEPGITCVVGPNGSGKSNVVDALAWVMGEQGAKSLRGGKMEDVIFAGTAGRPPLGRAEVSLTIDNTDGALPIEYAEVTISRTMFRSGGSEYAINGTQCRLLDVQELLSDSGIGREMHVVVGQGQLDSVLHATAEDRRGFIEEAAGVLKHRKRKEKALRKLESTDGNLTRLSDLLGEIRRQLKPLGRQAEVARQASVVQADLRDARARLLADDIVGVHAVMSQELADETILIERRAEVEQALAEARAAEAELEVALRDDLPALAKAQETWFGLSGLRERLLGTGSLAAERMRNAHGVEAEAGPSGPDPAELEAEAERLAEQEAAIAGEVREYRADLEATVVARRVAEDAADAEDRRVASLQRAAADRREGLARLHGEVNALKSRAAAAEDEVGRLRLAQADASARAERAEKDFTSLETKIAGLDAGEEGLDAEHETASLDLDELTERGIALKEELAAAERERGALRGRLDALELALNRKDGASALLAGSGSVPELSGLLGSVAGLLRVRSGFQTAVAAALGPVADAVVVSDDEAAIGALRHLHGADLGHAALLVAHSGESVEVPTELPEWAVHAPAVVDASTSVRPALDAVLGSTVIVDTVDQAREFVAAHPELIAVTKAGEIWARHVVAGGSSNRQTLLEAQVAYDDTAESVRSMSADIERLTFAAAELEGKRLDAAARTESALARLHESDATLAAVAEELGHLGSLARAARGEADRLATAIEQAIAARDVDLTGLSEWEARLAAAQDVVEDEPDTGDRERTAEDARAARQNEMDARLGLRTLEERARALQGRAETVRRTAAVERESRAKAAERRMRLIREGAVAAAVAAVVERVLYHLESSIGLATGERAEVERGRAVRERDLLSVRETMRELTRQHEELVSSVHRDEMARTQQRMRLEQLEERAREELGLDPETLMSDYGPDQLIPFSGLLAEGEETPAPTAYDRDEQAKRLRAAERKLAMLGRVNPLALEEFTAMEERHAFLTEQIEDLKLTRRDLWEIIREVDEQVLRVFADAYSDVEAAFTETFARLFPGGEGRLVLTDPGDMLTTGIEVEARPAGKKIKRLSLLSGGERSLVAVAFLVSLFKARPSPFYILDEVEAALDDTNLGRLLEIYEELRENSQLVVITHQKRTMEVGDALYGVTMRGDGVSTVISQRLRESEPVPVG